MNFSVEKDFAEGTTSIKVTFFDHEIKRLNLDSFDMALLADKEEQPADVLLKAEMLARRLQESRRSASSA